MKEVLAQFERRFNEFKRQVEENNTVLVIDDEDIVLSVMEEIILDMGLKVLLASTGNEGVEKALANHVNLVITDKNLPDISGIEVMSRIKERKRNVEIIMLTGYASFDSALKAIELGAYDYITKPFESVEFIRAKIKKALEKQNKILIYEKTIELLRELANEMLRELGAVSKKLVEEFARDLSFIKGELKRKNRAVVVISDAEERDFIKAIVEKLGCDVITAGDANEAENIFNRVNVDLLVVEKFLGTHNGLELFKTLKSKKPLLDGVLITTDNTLQGILSAISSGVSEYVLKPFESVDVLERKLKKVLREHNEKVKYTVLIERIKKLIKDALKVKKTGVTTAQDVSPTSMQQRGSPVQQIHASSAQEDGAHRPPQSVSTAQEHTSNKGAGAVQKREKILIVDDEEIILDVLEELLSDHGFEIVRAMSGEEAIEIVKKQGEFPVIITDKNLPGMSGIDLVMRVQIIHPDTQFVMITGYPSLESARNALKLRMCEYIVKPLTDINMILSAVEKALSKYKRRKKIQEELERLERENQLLKEKLTKSP